MNSPQTADIGKAAFYSSINIFLALTYVCNAFCRKCITRYHRFKNSCMDRGMLDEVILLLANNYSGLVNIGSGEPLTYQHLPFFVKNIIEQNEKIKFRILTNGMLLNENTPEYLFDKRITWGITLDGFDNNDLINLQQGVDLNIVKSNIAGICKKYGSESLYLNYTLNNQNIASLRGCIDFAYSNEIKELYLTELKIFRGFRKHLDNYKFNYEENGSRLAELETYAKGLGFTRFGTRAQKMNQCYNSGKVSPIIDIDGSVSFCYGREEHIIGTICEHTIYDAWHSLLTKLQTDPQAGGEWCSRCCSRKDKDGYFAVSSVLYPFTEEL